MPHLHKNFCKKSIWIRKLNHFLRKMLEIEGLLEQPTIVENNSDRNENGKTTINIQV